MDDELKLLIFAIAIIIALSIIRKYFGQSYFLLLTFGLAAYGISLGFIFFGGASQIKFLTSAIVFLFLLLMMWIFIAALSSIQLESIIPMLKVG